MAAAPLIIFLHNLKTGGTTLRDLLTRQYEPRRIRSVARRDDVRGLRDIAPLEDPKLAVVQGHMPFGLHARVSRPATYITFVRDPVERILSLYYFVLEEPGRAIHDEARPFLGSLAAFAQGDAVTELDNGQTRRISGCSPAIGECTREMLDLAKRNMRDHFRVVGITERFDESLWLMTRAFGWRDPFYIKRKVTQGKPPRESISSETLQLIEERNQLDRELYDYALELHASAVQAAGSEFQTQLGVFRALNTTLGEHAQRRRPADESTDALTMLLDAHAHTLANWKRAPAESGPSTVPRLSTRVVKRAAELVANIMPRGS